MQKENPPEVKAQFANMREEREQRMAALPQIRVDGEKALRRLFVVANGHSGQCKHIAAFLLGLYHGGRFRFDLTDLRCIDSELFDDCMAVLRMDSQPLREVHQYFENGGQRFEDMAIKWGIKDYLNSPCAVN